MSILNAIKETKHNQDNILDLAKLPQALIMQMAQRGEIPKEMVMPILSKKAELVESAARMKAAQGLAEQGGAQPTVMDQYMGKIAQAENPAPVAPPMAQAPQQMAAAPMPQGPEDVGIASQATQPMSMAGGGIIAFDDGGEVEDEDTYRKMVEDAREEAEDNDIYDMIASLKGNAGVGIKAGSRGAERGMEDKGDLESRLRAAIMGKESGGRRYDKAGNLLTSSKGAQGEMQVMPGTARDPGFGIRAAKGNDPEELRRVGDEYASVLLNRYGDPKLAMIAYNMGPGATDKWLAAGADVRKLPKETQGYIRGVSLAQGGEVQHYAAGDYVGFGEEAPYDPESSWGIKEWWKRNTPGSKEFIKEQEASKKKAAPAKTTAAPAQAPAPAPKTEIPQNAAGIVNLKQDQEDKEFNMMDYIKGRESRMAASEEKDKWLAGLAAGLGMLGGTSQYAWENIGKGGQAGVQQLASSQKTRAAQEAALGSLYGSAAKLSVMEKLRRDQLGEKTREFDDRQAQALLTAKNSFIAKRLKERGMDEMMLGTLKRQQAMGKLDPAKIPELNYYEKQMRDIEAEANRMFASPRSSSGVIKLD